MHRALPALYARDVQGSAFSSRFAQPSCEAPGGGKLSAGGTCLTHLDDSSQTCSLDLLGNWDSTVNDATTETRTHHSVNGLTARTVGQDPQISLPYDDAGNLTQDGDSDGDHKYTWTTGTV